MQGAGRAHLAVALAAAHGACAPLGQRLGHGHLLLRLLPALLPALGLVARRLALGAALACCRRSCMGGARQLLRLLLDCCISGLLVCLLLAGSRLLCSLLLHLLRHCRLAASRLCHPFLLHSCASCALLLLLDRRRALLLRCLLGWRLGLALAAGACSGRRLGLLVLLAAGGAVVQAHRLDGTVQVPHLQPGPGSVRM